MSASRGTPGAPLLLLRIGYGLVNVLAPGWLAGFVLGRPPRPGTRRFARVLGARHLAQALVDAAWPRRWVLAAGAVVDGLHALSTLAVAITSRRWHRAALANACLAAIFATGGARAALQPPDRGVAAARPGKAGS